MDITGANGAASTLAAVATLAPVPPEQAATNRNVIRAVKAVNDAGILGDNNEITFQIDRNSRLPLIRIIDRTTNYDQ